MRIILLFLCILSISIACNRGPKIIESETSETGMSNNEKPQSTGIFSSAPSSSSKSPTQKSNVQPNNEFHQVFVNEVLPTDKYVYLNVTEEGTGDYWIATMKREAKVGETYFYKEGLLKTNFESKEYNRVFKKVYLVSNIVPANHASQQASSTSNNNTAPEVKDVGSVDVEGSIKIAEIVSNPQDYANKEVQISGQVTKINPNIMGRNWIHIRDGSKDDYDMVITSNQIIAEGNIVTMQGIVRLNKDFGAGYRYDIIIEDGKVEI